MAGEKAKLLCSFGGGFVREQGRAFYVGGKTHLVTIERSAGFRSLLAKMSEICDADPRSLDVRFQLPDDGVSSGLDSRLVSVEDNDDVSSMMEEFDSNRKIPIFLFRDEEGIAMEDSMPHRHLSSCCIRCCQGNFLQRNGNGGDKRRTS